MGSNIGFLRREGGHGFLNILQTWYHLYAKSVSKFQGKIWQQRTLAAILGGCVCIPICFRRVRLFATLMDYRLPGFSVHSGSPGKNTGMCCHALLPGDLLTQGLNPSLLCLLQQQAGSLTLVPLGKPQVIVESHYLFFSNYADLILPLKYNPQECSFS